MSDRLHASQTRRTDAVPAARLRSRSPQGPLGAWQTQAGNRAVASAIRGGAGTAVQRASGTAQLPATTSSSADDLRIIPVTETAGTGGGTGREEAATTERRAAVDEVAAQKANVAAASLARAGAEAEVWKSSGEVVESRRKAAAARGEAERLTEEAESAERGRTTSLEAAHHHTEAAGRASGDRRAAEGRARTHQETEVEKRSAADEARAREQEFTRQAEAAERERGLAAARVAEFTEKAEEARKKQKAAEARVAELTRQAEEAGREQKAAEAAAKAKAGAEDQALQQAARAEAEAEAEGEVAKSVAKWAEQAARALRQAGDAEREARERGEEATGADASRSEAEREAEDWAETRRTAQEQAEKARDLAALRDKEADAAAKERGEAEHEAAEHRKTAAEALKKAEKARGDAETYARTATELRQQAESARALELEQAGIAAGAQRSAAGAARTQAARGTEQTGATAALTAAKAAREAEQKAADEKAAEAAKKSTQEAAKKSAAEAGGKSTAQAAGPTDEAGPADASGAGTALRKGADRVVKGAERAANGVGHAAKKVAAKVKPWVDGPDTAILRGSAPPGGVLRAEASKTGDTGRLHGTVLQQNAENPVNLISDATGAVNDVAALKDAAGKRHESGPASHAHRKNWVGKPLGLTTNSLMTVNDAVKITDNSIRTAKDMAGVAALGDAGGALTMTFSTLIAARDVKVLKDTHARRKELKEHFKGVVAKRDRKLQDVLNELGTASDRLAQGSVTLAAAPAGADAEALRAVGDERARIEGLRQELMGHLAAARDYAVDKKKRKLRHRATNLGGNVARTAAGSLAIAAAAGAVSGGIAPAVAGGATAAALGGLAVKKAVKKGRKRYTSVREPERYARTTLPQEGTPDPEAPVMSKDGQGGRKRDAWKEAFMVTHSIKQGKRQLRAQEIYALAAGPAVPASRNVPDDVREETRAFLKSLKCGPDKHNQSEDEWLASLNDPEKQTEWEEAIAKQLASV
ncbi:hypothetical protein EV562_1193 [Streptomyces sp. BK208]|uniref:hypothetical protein n=1 Tax=Streptomyces sp. BK208 TaxID=2512150 RepID=UPI0010F01C28|nr:hypothetical protein [Streptomyces sp. BK208]TDT23981.1 hypothetical protein EV562_1193 [Streptomyces sp. BK208]